MSGENAILYVPDYGARKVVVTHLEYGVHIISDGAEARSNRTLYTRQKSGSSFLIHLDHSTQEDRQAMFDWMASYLRLLSRGKAKVMRVIIPSQNFSRLGVPESPIAFGDRPSDVKWVAVIDFSGFSDAVTKTQAGVTSNFKAGSSNKPDNGFIDAKWFYPSLTSGRDVDDLYDVPLEDFHLGDGGTVR